MNQLNTLITVIFGAGGALFLRSAFAAVRGWRADTALSEETMIGRLNRSNKELTEQWNALVAERDGLFEDRSLAMEIAQRYRMLAIHKGASKEELDAVAKAWDEPGRFSPTRRKLATRPATARPELRANKRGARNPRKQEEG